MNLEEEMKLRVLRRESNLLGSYLKASHVHLKVVDDADGFRLRVYVRRAEGHGLHYCHTYTGGPWLYCDVWPEELEEHRPWTVVAYDKLSVRML